MKALVRRTTALVGMTVLTALSACSDSGDSSQSEALQLQDIAGTWQATKFELTDVATNEKVEWLSAGVLAEFTMTITASGTVTFAAREPSESEPDISGGTITLDGANVTIDFGDDVMTGTVVLKGRELTIDIPELEDGIRLVMVFNRM